MRNWGTLALVFSLVGISPGTAAESCDRTYVEGVGEACQMSDGSYELLVDAGTGLRVHGPDYLGPPESANASAPRDPDCVTSSDEYGMQVVYAHPYNEVNQYNQRVEAIRDLVRRANGELAVRADPFGYDVDYKVVCDEFGEIVVENEQLPTAAESDSFSTVTEDLSSLGYTSSRRKIWVWYEGRATATIAGVGHVYNDDRATDTNANNGHPSAPSMFAVLYGQVANYAVRTWMHENAHTMGAVQDSAPNSSGNYHCNDGRDYLCYADGGPNSDYSASVCAVEVFDCGLDDYFHPSPTPGSYLSNYWNLGHSRNRFLQVVQRPSIRFVTSSMEVTEQDGTISVALVREGSTVEASQVRVTSSHGTTDASDFDAVDEYVNFGSGQTSAFVDVTVHSDALQEPVETFSLHLEESFGGQVVSPSELEIELSDGTHLIAWAQEALSVEESAGTVPLTVTRTETSTSASVKYATVADSAEEGTDFVDTQGTLEFAVGQSVQTVFVPVVNDSVQEPTESFSVVLSEPSGALISYPSEILVTIIDEDAPPDTTPPNAQINADPVQLTIFDQYLRGEVTDDTSVERVRVRFHNRISGEASSQEANLTCSSATSCSFRVLYPGIGRYGAIADAWDTAGNFRESRVVEVIFL